MRTIENGDRKLRCRRVLLISNVSRDADSAIVGGVERDECDVVAAVEQEYRKLGRLVLEREFGHYYGLIG